MASLLPLGPGLHVLQRGWLSSNNILLRGDDGVTLIDSGHCVHAEQTVALVRQALGAQPLRELINTHLHSDHCGGNAMLQRAFGAAVFVPEASADAVRAWDGDALSYDATGQRCARFSVQGTTRAGDVIEAGRGASACRFEVIEAPGHDPQSTMLFERSRGLLVSADALWQNGFGVVFPELDGEPGFDDVAAVLDAIEGLPVQLVVPGHGAPFTDVAAALMRARSRLAAFVADPRRHARHGAKVLLKYHLMEVREESLAALQAWTGCTALLRAVWASHARAEAASPEDWALLLAEELVAAGALRHTADGLADA